MSLFGVSLPTDVILSSIRIESDGVYYERDNGSVSNSGGYTTYDEFKDVMYYIWHTGSKNTKNITQLLSYKARNISAGVGSYQDGYIGPAHLALYMDKTAVPQTLKYFSPVNGKEIPFKPTNTVIENFPTKYGVQEPYAIRIFGYFGKRYPSRIGTIYFKDWDTFYNFSKYIHIGEY